MVMKFDKICEMEDITTLLKALISPNQSNLSNQSTQVVSVKNPIQPNDAIGEFGNIQDIQIKSTDEGGIEIDSKEMAIKISKKVFDAIGSFINQHGISKG